MADVKIFNLTIKNTPETTDEIEIQATGGSTSSKTTLGNLSSILGSSVDGFYGDSSDIANDVTYAIADFVGTGERPSAIIAIATSATVTHPSAIFSCDGTNLYTIYGNTDSWDNGNTANNDTASRINIWVDSTTNPNSIKVKNRTGTTHTFRFFALSWSTSGA